MLMSIDPGINNTGITVFDILDNNFKIYDTFSICNLRKFTEEEKALEEYYDTRTVKVLYILDFIKGILEKYEINQAIVEAPFYNALTPVAFGSLLEVISSIKYNIFVSRNIKFNTLEPLLIKKFFTKERLANKQFIKQLFIDKINRKEIILENNLQIDQFNEHQIDSVAIGFTWFILQGKKKC